jgi:hypothetical protein
MVKVNEFARLTIPAFKSAEEMRVLIRKIDNWSISHESDVLLERMDLPSAEQKLVVGELSVLDLGFGSWDQVPMNSMFGDSLFERFRAEGFSELPAFSVASLMIEVDKKYRSDPKWVNLFMRPIGIDILDRIFRIRRGAQNILRLEVDVANNLRVRIGDDFRWLVRLPE